MPILSYDFNFMGQSGDLPSLIYLYTNDPVSTVTSASYLRGLVNQGLPGGAANMALVVTKETSDSESSIAWYSIIKTGEIPRLQPANSPTSVVSVPYGGTGISAMTPYSVLVGGTTATGNMVSLPSIGDALQVLTSNGAGALPTWEDVPGGLASVVGTAGQIAVVTALGEATVSIDATYIGQASITTLGTITEGIWNSDVITVPYGGTGVATMTTAYAPVCAGTTATGNLQVASTGLSTSGYVLTSTGASSLPTFQEVPGRVVWSNVSGTSQTAVVGNGYIIGNAAQTTVTLPATAAVGSVIAIAGKGAGGWILDAPGSQVINVGQSATSAGGTVTSAANFNCIEVVCVTVDSEWVMTNSVTSGFTVA